MMNILNGLFLHINENSFAKTTGLSVRNASENDVDFVKRTLFFYIIHKYAQH